MSKSLERVLTFSQNTMLSASLPLELQQQIFSYLDSKTFNSARRVCRWWRFAATDVVTLERQLKKLPVRPQVDARVTHPEELQVLFDKAARILMFGMELSENLRRSRSFGSDDYITTIPWSQKSATSRNGRMAILEKRQVKLFDTSARTSNLLTERTLPACQELSGESPWLNVAPASHALALSSDGRLLAIAKERMIQIYDVSGDLERSTINEHVSGAAGHYIRSLDFEQDDHVLRVRLSGGGRVLYLGTPKISGETRSNADFDHWNGKSGLSHMFLDSSLLTVNTESPSTEHAARVSGIQLLRPFCDGFLFAAQKHGGGESSHYILGHVNCSAPHNAYALAAEPYNVTVLSRLESFLSASDYVLNESADSGMGLWDNMPSAHEHSPRFALSLGNHSGMLLVAEREKKRIRPREWTQPFVYSIPGERRLQNLFEEKKAQRTGRWSRLSNLMQHPKEAQESLTTEVDARPTRVEHTIARLPLCLGVLPGNVTGLAIESSRRGTSVLHVVNVKTVEESRIWTLTES